VVEDGGRSSRRPAVAPAEGVVDEVRRGANGDIPASDWSAMSTRLPGGKDECPHLRPPLVVVSSLSSLSVKLVVFAPMVWLVRFPSPSRV